MEGINAPTEPGALINDNQWKKRNISKENKYELYFSDDRVHLEEFIK